MRCLARSFLETFRLIEIVALSFIAYQIGGELGFRQSHREGRALGILALTQAVTAYLFVACLLWLCSGDSLLSFILAATAAATAPAAVKAVLNESGTKSEFSTFLYRVVAAEGFSAILFFAVTVSVLGVHGQFLFHAAREIMGALVLGNALGHGVSLLQRFRAGRESILCLRVFISSHRNGYWLHPGEPLQRGSSSLYGSSCEFVG